MKPQVAFITLPWTLWRWVEEDRSTLVLWLVLTAALWGGLLVFDPAWPIRWHAVLSDAGTFFREDTPSLWNLVFLVPKVRLLLIPLAVVLLLWGLLQRREVSWATVALVHPAVRYYDLVVLLGAAPPFLLVPLSWIAVGLTLGTRSFLPWTLIPLAVILHQVVLSHLRR